MLKMKLQFKTVDPTKDIKVFFDEASELSDVGRGRGEGVGGNREIKVL